MDQIDTGTVMALVKSHIVSDPGNLQWVPGYTKIRWTEMYQRVMAERVAGHYRRRANVKRTADAISCVCKQPDLTTPPPHAPRTGRRKRTSATKRVSPEPPPPSPALFH